MGNRERLLTLVFGAALLALGMFSTGTAMADSVNPFVSSTPPYKDPAGNTWTDPRGSMANRPGTLVEARYGPFSVPHNCVVNNNCPHNVVDFNALPPCTSCYITDNVAHPIHDVHSRDGQAHGPRT